MNAQFIVVTHSPILLGMPNAEILTFDELYERARFITEYDPKLYSE